MNCCDDFTGKCNQGHNCPARETLIRPVLDKLPAPTHCETAKQSCATPWTCSPACRLNTANSDGSSPHTAEVWELTPLGWAVLACLIVGISAASYFFLKL